MSTLLEQLDSQPEKEQQKNIQTGEVTYLEQLDGNDQEANTNSLPNTQVEAPQVQNNSQTNIPDVNQELNVIKENPVLEQQAQQKANQIITSGQNQAVSDMVNNSFVQDFTNKGEEELENGSIGSWDMPIQDKILEAGKNLLYTTGQGYADAVGSVPKTAQVWSESASDILSKIIGNNPVSSGLDNFANVSKNVADYIQTPSKLMQERLDKRSTDFLGNVGTQVGGFIPLLHILSLTGGKGMTPMATSDIRRSLDESEQADGIKRSRLQKNLTSTIGGAAVSQAWKRLNLKTPLDKLMKNEFFSTVKQSPIFRITPELTEKGGHWIYDVANKTKHKWIKDMLVSNSIDTAVKTTADQLIKDISLASAGHKVDFLKDAVNAFIGGYGAGALFTGGHKLKGDYKTKFKTDINEIPDIYQGGGYEAGFRDHRRSTKEAAKEEGKKEATKQLSRQEQSRISGSKRVLLTDSEHATRQEVLKVYNTLLAVDHHLDSNKDINGKKLDEGTKKQYQEIKKELVKYLSKHSEFINKNPDLVDSVVNTETGEVKSEREFKADIENRQAITDYLKMKGVKDPDLKNLNFDDPNTALNALVVVKSDINALTKQREDFSGKLEKAQSKNLDNAAKIYQEKINTIDKTIDSLDSMNQYLGDIVHSNVKYDFAEPTPEKNLTAKEEPAEVKGSEEDILRKEKIEKAKYEAKKTSYKAKLDKEFKEIIARSTERDLTPEEEQRLFELDRKAEYVHSEKPVSEMEDGELLSDVAGKLEAFKNGKLDAYENERGLNLIKELTKRGYEFNPENNSFEEHKPVVYTPEEGETHRGLSIARMIAAKRGINKDNIVWSNRKSSYVLDKNYNYEASPEKDKKKMEIKNGLLSLYSELTGSDLGHVKRTFGINDPVSTQKEKLESKAEQVEDRGSDLDLYGIYENILQESGIGGMDLKDELHGDSELADKVKQAIIDKIWEKTPDEIMNQRDKDYAEYLETQTFNKLKGELIEALNPAMALAEQQKAIDKFLKENKDTLSMFENEKERLAQLINEVKNEYSKQQEGTGEPSEVPERSSVQELSGAEDSRIDGEESRTNATNGTAGSIEQPLSYDEFLANELSLASNLDGTYQAYSRSGLGSYYKGSTKPTEQDYKKYYEQYKEKFNDQSNTEGLSGNGQQGQSSVNASNTEGSGSKTEKNGDSSKTETSSKNADDESKSNADEPTSSVQQASNGSGSRTVNNSLKKAFEHLIGQIGVSEPIVKKLIDKFNLEKPDGWQDSSMKIRAVKNIIKQALDIGVGKSQFEDTQQDQARINHIVELLKDYDNIQKSEFKNSENVVQSNGTKEVTEDAGNTAGTKNKRGNKNSGQAGVPESSSGLPDRSRLHDTENPEHNEEKPESGYRPSVPDNRGLVESDQALVEKDYKNRKELNDAIKNWIENKGFENYVELPEKLQNWLKKYTGAGGVKGEENSGILDEYYTPEKLVNKMWDLARNYTDGNMVFEPSLGIGKFFFDAPEGYILHGTEYSDISGQIAKLLNPEADIAIKPFQDVFMTEDGRNIPDKNNPSIGKYDVVIGNPPYKPYEGKYKAVENKNKAARLEEYFIDRGLDLLKDGGVLVYVIPRGVLNNASSKVKEAIAAKGNLVDAYRLPDGIFQDTGVGTDLIVIKKEAGNILDYVDGNFFKNNPEKILGELSDKKGQWGMDIFKGDISAIDKIKTEKPAKTAETNVIGNPITGEKSLNGTYKDKGFRGHIYTRTDEGWFDETTKNFIAESQNARFDNLVKSNILKPYDKETKSVKPSEAKPVEKKPEESKPVAFEEYKPENKMDEKEIHIWQNTNKNNSVNLKVEYNPSLLNYYNGEVYHNFYYLQDNLYLKLDQLEQDKNNISEEQYKKQKNLLEKNLVKQNINEFTVDPVSNFAKDLLSGKVKTSQYRDRYGKTVSSENPTTAVEEFKSYLETVSSDEREGVPATDIISYLDGRNPYPITAGTGVKYVDGKERRYKTAADIKNNAIAVEKQVKLANVTERLFNDYIRNHIDDAAKKQIENKFNREYNAVIKPDYEKLPLLVKGMSAKFKGRKLNLIRQQIRGVNFLTTKGTGVLAYGTGIGKTITGIIATVQNMQMGRSKRPLFIVPKNTLKKWINEAKMLFPNIKINNFENMGVDVNEVPVEDGSLTFITHEAFANLWYKDKNIVDNFMYEVHSQSTRPEILGRIPKTDKERKQDQKALDKAASLVSEAWSSVAKSKRKKLFYIDELGFDHVTVDETHLKFKGVFEGLSNRGDDAIRGTGGGTSKSGAALFLLTQYILRNNDYRNVYHLTATPFENKIVEIYTMLSYVGRYRLDQMGLLNVHDFIKAFTDIESRQVPSNDLETIKTEKQIRGFKNAVVFKKLISEFIDYESSAEVDKPKKKTVSVELNKSSSQERLTKRLKEQAKARKSGNDKNAARASALIYMTKEQLNSLSPYIAEMPKSTEKEARAEYIKEVDPTDFVESSPKIKYAVESIKQVLKDDPKTSQILYMDRGVEFFGHIKKYIVKQGILKPNEIITTQEMNDKEKIADMLNDINNPVKLLIGSSAISTGMDLQQNSSVLYNLSLDFNPTTQEQIEGRIWRQGNPYKNIRIVYPLMKNSSDVFMFRILGDKTARLNDIFSQNGEEYISTGEINPDEYLEHLIDDPEMKYAIYVDSKINALEQKKALSEDQMNSLDRMKRDYEHAKRMMERANSNINTIQDRIKGYEKKFEETANNWYMSQVADYKKELAAEKQDFRYYKGRLETFDKKLKINQIDLNNIEVEKSKIREKIVKIENEIEQVRSEGGAKLEEFKREFEQNREKAPTIDELMGDVKELNKTHLEKKPEYAASGAGKDAYIKLESVKTLDELNQLGSSTRNEEGKFSKKTRINKSKELKKQLETVLVHGNYSEVFKKHLLNTFKDLSEGEKKYILKNIVENYKNLATEIKDKNQISTPLKEWINDRETNINLKKFDVDVAYMKGVKNLYGKADEIFNKLSNAEKKSLGLSKAQFRDNIEYISNFLRQRTDIPKEIADFDEYQHIPDVYNMLTERQKEDLTDIIDNIAEMTKFFYHEYVITKNDIDWSDPDFDLENLGKENYVPQIWDKNSFNTNSGGLGNLVGSTTSRFAKQRKLPDYKTGVELGYKPKNLRALDAYKAAAYSMIKAVEDHRVVKLVNSYNIGGLPAIVRGDLAPKDWKVVNHIALKKSLYLATKVEKGEAVAPALEKILNEIGVVIGKNLSKKSNAEGMLVYKKDQITSFARFQKYVDESTIAHEVGHHIDRKLDLSGDFFNEHSDEIFEINKDRIEGFAKYQPDKLAYAQSAKEQIAEFVSAVFTDPNRANDLAPNATNDFIAMLGKDKFMRKLLPQNYDWSKAKELIYERMTKRLDMPVRVHPDIQREIDVLFQPKIDNSWFNAVETVFGVQKRNALMLSFFHAEALFEAGISNLRIMSTMTDIISRNPSSAGKVIDLLNPVKIYKAVVKKEFDYMKNTEFFKDALKAEIQIGSPTDYQREQIKNFAVKLVGGTGDKLMNLIPALKDKQLATQIASTVVESMDTFLWDYMHTSLKLWAYDYLLQQEMKYINGEVNSFSAGFNKMMGWNYDKNTPVDVIKKEIGKYINDNFGGQNWKRLNITEVEMQMQRLALISPDWLYSTTVHGLAFTGVGSRYDKKIRAKLGGTFWISAMIISTMLISVLNVMFREFDKAFNPELYTGKNLFDELPINNAGENGGIFMPSLFIGRDKQGREQYFRYGKQWRELPELLENPRKKIGGKFHMMWQLISTVLTGNSLSGYEDKEYSKVIKEGNIPQNIGATIGLAVKSFFPMSSSAVSEDGINVAKLFSPVAKGMTVTKGVESYKKAMEAGDINKINQITDDLIDNRINALRVAKNALKDNYEPPSFNDSKNKIFETLKDRMNDKNYKGSMLAGFSGEERSEARKTLTFLKLDQRMVRKQERSRSLTQKAVLNMFKKKMQD